MSDIIDGSGLWRVTTTALPSIGGSVDIIDGSGLWSVTSGALVPPPIPPIVVSTGGGAGGRRGRLIHTMEDRSYYEALKYWLALGRKDPMDKSERELLEMARRRAQWEREEEEILL